MQYTTAGLQYISVVDNDCIIAPRRGVMKVFLYCTTNIRQDFACRNTAKVQDTHSNFGPWRPSLPVSHLWKDWRHDTTCRTCLHAIDRCTISTNLWLSYSSEECRGDILCTDLEAVSHTCCSSLQNSRYVDTSIRSRTFSRESTNGDSACAHST